MIDGMKEETFHTEILLLCMKAGSPAAIYIEMGAHVHAVGARLPRQQSLQLIVLQKIPCRLLLLFLSRRQKAQT